jgi:hypothetical protein
LLGLDYEATYSYVPTMVVPDTAGSILADFASKSKEVPGAMAKVRDPDGGGELVGLTVSVIACVPVLLTRYNRLELGLAKMSILASIRNVMIAAIPRLRQNSSVLSIEKRF